MVRKGKVVENQYLEDKSVDNEVINIAGYLRDPRFLPYLKNMDKGNYVGREAELALARYGEEPYYSKAIKKYAYGKRFRSRYISVN